MTRPDAKAFAPLDDEERELIEAIEAADHVLGQSGLTPDRMEALQAAARATASEPSTKVSIRLARTDLARIKAREAPHPAAGWTGARGKDLVARARTLAQRFGPPRRLKANDCDPNRDYPRTGNDCHCISNRNARVACCA